MDKSTLSNYGWIVIAVLVLSVMIALATPFGQYIENGVRATTEGLFSTSQNAMNTAFGDLGVEVESQTFEEGYKTSDRETNSQLNHSGTIPEGGIYITGLKNIWNDAVLLGRCPICNFDSWCACDAIVYKEGDEFPETVQKYDFYAYGEYIYMYEGEYGCGGCPFYFIIDGVKYSGMHDTCGQSPTDGWSVGLLNKNITSLSTNFLNIINNKPILQTQGLLDSSLIKEYSIPKNITTVGRYFFFSNAIETVKMHDGVESIANYSFWNTSMSINVLYDGTKTQWDAIPKEELWNLNTEVILTCTDGVFSIQPAKDPFLTP